MCRTVAFAANEKEENCMMNKKTASLLCTAAMLVSAATGCTAEAAPASEPASAAQTAAAAAASTKIPKYVFYLSATE